MIKYSFKSFMNGNIPMAESSEELDEVMTIQRRNAAKRMFKRIKNKIRIGKKRAEKRIKSPDKLKKVADRHARLAMIKKLTKGAKGDLDFARRSNVEKRLSKMKGKLKTMSKKLLPAIRKKEMNKRKKKSA